MAEANDPWNIPLATTSEPPTEPEIKRGIPKPEQLPKLSKRGRLPRLQEAERAAEKVRIKERASKRKAKHRKAVEAIAPGSPAWANQYPVKVDHDRRLTDGELATIRYAAALHYITDLNGCTVKDMAKTPQFSMVKVGTLDEWCAKDKWVARRHEKLESLRAAIEARVGDSIVQKQADMLKSIEDMCAQAVGMTQPNDKGHFKVEPNSWEGVANFALRAAKLANELRSNLITRLVPAQPEQEAKRQKASSIPPQAVLTPDQMRTFAHQMLSKNHPSKDLSEPEVVPAPTDEE